MREPQGEINPIEVNKKIQKNILIWMLAIFAAVTAAEIAAAYYVVYQQGNIMADALSRSANAYYVLNLKPAKLASIGFVWNPLPSLLQIPLMYFARFWKPLASVGFAGCIQSAVFAGINAALLFRYLRQADLKTITSMLIVILYACNPFVFFYGFNGMSETMFLTAVIVATANFSMWLDDRQTDRLVAVALMLAMAFLTRYEVFALMLGFGIALLIAVYRMPDKKSPFTEKPLKMKWDYFVATGTMIFLPVIYTILLWMFLNWVIMGSPIYFLNSSYSNDAQSALLHPGFKEEVSGLLPALKYTLGRMLPFAIPFIAITIERIYTKRLIKPDYLILLVLVGAISVFHIFMLMAQKSYGWLRFYSFSLFISVAWFPFEIRQFEGRAKKFVTALLCLSLVLSAAAVGKSFKNDDFMKEEKISFSENSGTSLQRELARHINEKYGESIILLDSFTLSTLITNLDHPENVLTSISDELFELAVADPVQSEADYIIVPTVYTQVNGRDEIGGIGVLDYINQCHPSLYDGELDWTELVYEVNSFRMYKIVREDKETSELAKYINGSSDKDTVVLFDIARAGALKGLLADSENAITTCSENFNAAIENPQEHYVNLMVLAKPDSDKTQGLDEVSAHYPDFMSEGVDFAELVFENEKYQVYEVIYN